MPYTPMTAFENSELTFGQPGEGNYGYTARKSSPYEENDAFDESVFLLYRRSEYAAQVELACAKIFSTLMGYGPEMEIVQDTDNGDFFIASRAIKDFAEGYPTLESEDDSDKFKGLAAISVLTYFLGETDNHSGNFGFQQQDDGTARAYRIDMAEAFDLEAMLPSDLRAEALHRLPYHVEAQYQGANPDLLPRAYVESAVFQAEKKAMMRLIADTPFETFETIIRETISSTPYKHREAEFALIFVLCPDIPDEIKSTMLQEFKATITPEEHSLERVIELLQRRHSQWQTIVEANDLGQDYTLADSDAFMAACDEFNPPGSDSGCDSGYDSEGSSIASAGRPSS